jgi:hypothetical protein
LKLRITLPIQRFSPAQPRLQDGCTPILSFRWPLDVGQLGLVEIPFAPAAGAIADVFYFPVEGCSGDGSNAMSATGLDVFDKTLQTTNIWLDDIMEVLGPDRRDGRIIFEADA